MCTKGKMRRKLNITSRTQCNNQLDLLQQSVFVHVNTVETSYYYILYEVQWLKRLQGADRIYNLIASKNRCNWIVCRSLS
jgi:hypothetical protein